MSRHDELSAFARSLLVDALPQRSDPPAAPQTPTPAVDVDALDDYRCTCGSHKCHGRCEPGR